MNETTPKTKREDEDPDVFMQRQKERLEKQREEVLSRRAAIDDELAALNQKLGRIEFYFNPTPMREPRITKARTTGTRKPRQSGVRDNVLAKIKEHAQGISRKDLLLAMGATDKSAEQSISNAVAALKKDGKITSDSGIYKAV